MSHLIQFERLWQCMCRHELDVGKWGERGVHGAVFVKKYSYKDLIQFL